MTDNDSKRVKNDPTENKQLNVLEKHKLPPTEKYTTFIEEIRLLKRIPKRGTRCWGGEGSVDIQLENTEDQETNPIIRGRI